MVKNIKRCLQLSLKLVNATMAALGIAMILYGVWMIRVWQRDAKGSFDSYNYALPWFIHVFLGIGIVLCGITCLGHFAALTANHYCLSSYSVIIFLLIILDSIMVADVFLNSDWEKDIPEDPSGRFDDFKDFVKSNIHVCKWISLFIIFTQVCSILLATVLRTLGSDDDLNMDSSDDDDDDNEESNQSRVPFLNQPVQAFPSYVVGEGEPYVLHNTDDIWSSKKNHPSSHAYI